MPFEIIRSDITALPFHVDAIVNTANPHPIIGSGTDTAVHEAAGERLLQARREIGDIERGSAAITPAFDLRAKYVIHAVGPAWQGGEHGEEDTLRKAYDSALSLAAENDCDSVAFPLMSSGNYGFPRDRALSIAIAAFSDFLLRQEMQIYLVVFSREAFVLSTHLMQSVESYIDEHYIAEKIAHEYRHDRGGRRLREESALSRENRIEADYALSAPMIVPAAIAAPSIEDRLAQKSETFTQALRRIMIERDLSNPDVYKRANMGKKTFNKIYNDLNHQPSKRSALQIAIALEMNLDDTKDFIARAGYALSPSSRFDVVLSCLIEQGVTNMLEVDAVLFEFTETTLSSCN